MSYIYKNFEHFNTYFDVFDIIVDKYKEHW